MDHGEIKRRAQTQRKRGFPAIGRAKYTNTRSQSAYWIHRLHTPGLNRPSRDAGEDQGLCSPSAIVRKTFLS